MSDGTRLAARQGRSTDALIDSLVDDLPVASPAAPLRALITATGIGAACSALILMAVFGPRPDMAAALHGLSFWAKLAFPLALALAGLMAADRLGRPGAPIGRGPLVGAFAIGAMVLLAVGELAMAPAGQLRALLLGHTLDHCTALVVLFSLPVLAGGMLAMRRMAPTRLRLAGAAVGILAGGTSAAVYAIACDETALPFVALWYGAGIALTGLIGALVGPRLLRW